MFISYWHPAARSSRPASSPLQLPLSGQDFVLSGNATGTVRHTGNNYNYRSGPLDPGKAVKGRIQRPYDGQRVALKTV